MQILDGSKLAKHIRNELKKEIEPLNAKPKLCVLLVGEDPASEIYVNYKRKACAEVGIDSEVHQASSDSTEEELFAIINEWNLDPSVNGILVQLPLPSHLDEFSVLDRIHPSKDVDCLTPYNQGLMALGTELVAPCTPSGILDLLAYNQINPAGKDVVVIGRSKIVGKPMALMLLNENASVSVCHSKTKDLKAYTQKADIIIVATGQPHLIGAEHVKEGAVVIDVGIHRGEDGLMGDVDFDEVKDIASHLSPVPGGVGPMTIASLLKNTLALYYFQYPELVE